jgi:hypothetical protein
MKVNEIRDYVNQVAHECSNHSYFACIHKEESRFKAMYAVDTLIALAGRMNIGLKVINDEYCWYSAVYAPIGKNKMYFRWVPACDCEVDKSTYEEYKKVVSHYLDNGYECYTTDGNNGMNKINGTIDL